MAHEEDEYFLEQPSDTIIPFSDADESGSQRTRLRGRLLRCRNPLATPLPSAPKVNGVHDVESRLVAQKSERTAGLMVSATPMRGPKRFLKVRCYSPRASDTSSSLATSRDNAQTTTANSFLDEFDPHDQTLTSATANNSLRENPIVGLSDNNSSLAKTKRFTIGHKNIRANQLEAEGVQQIRTEEDDRLETGGSRPNGSRDSAENRTDSAGTSSEATVDEDNFKVPFLPEKTNKIRRTPSFGRERSPALKKMKTDDDGGLPPPRAATTSDDSVEQLYVKARYMTNWTPRLRGRSRLVVDGDLLNFAAANSNCYENRWSTSTIHRVIRSDLVMTKSGPYVLEGPMNVSAAGYLPRFIMTHFKSGFPSNWTVLRDIWSTMENQHSSIDSSSTHSNSTVGRSGFFQQDTTSQSWSSGEKRSNSYSREGQSTDDDTEEPPKKRSPKDQRGRVKKTRQPEVEVGTRFNTTKASSQDDSDVDDDDTFWRSRGSRSPSAAASARNSQVKQDAKSAQIRASSAVKRPQSRRERTNSPAAERSPSPEKPANPRRKRGGVRPNEGNTLVDGENSPGESSSSPEKPANSRRKRGPARQSEGNSRADRANPPAEGSTLPEGQANLRRKKGGVRQIESNSRADRANSPAESSISPEKPVNLRRKGASIRQNGGNSRVDRARSPAESWIISEKPSNSRRKRGDVRQDEDNSRVDRANSPEESSSLPEKQANSRRKRGDVRQNEVNSRAGRACSPAEGSNSREKRRPCATVSRKKASQPLKEKEVAARNAPVNLSLTFSSEDDDSDVDGLKSGKYCTVDVERCSHDSDSIVGKLKNGARPGPKRTKEVEKLGKTRGRQQAKQQSCPSDVDFRDDSTSPLKTRSGRPTRQGAKNTAKPRSSPVRRSQRSNNSAKRPERSPSPPLINETAQAADEIPGKSTVRGNSAKQAGKNSGKKVDNKPKKSSGGRNPAKRADSPPRKSVGDQKKSTGGRKSANKPSLAGVRHPSEMIKYPSFAEKRPSPSMLNIPPKPFTAKNIRQKNKYLKDFNTDHSDDIFCQNPNQKSKSGTRTEQRPEDILEGLFESDSEKECSLYSTRTPVGKYFNAPDEEEEEREGTDNFSEKTAVVEPGFQEEAFIAKKAKEAKKRHRLMKTKAPSPLVISHPPAGPLSRRKTVEKKARNAVEPFSQLLNEEKKSNEDDSDEECEDYFTDDDTMTTTINNPPGGLLTFMASINNGRK